jgi:flagellar hook-basal body complex protein FliE
MTTINSISAGINAYRDVAGVGGSAKVGGTGGAAAPAESNFTTELKSAVQDALSALHEGEQKSMQGVAGQVDIRDVVMAVNSAEITLQTVTAVRDKVIQAYQEIMRMPI